jgi:hypothetical protein
VELSSDAIKASVAAYFRYTRQYPLVAFEDCSSLGWGHPEQADVLVVRTGGKVTNQRIAMAAIKKDWHLQAYGAGFSTPQGDVICKSERDVFELVGLRYLEPWQRE